MNRSLAPALMRIDVAVSGAAVADGRAADGGLRSLSYQTRIRCESARVTGPRAAALLTCAEGSPPDGAVSGVGTQPVRGAIFIPAHSCDKEPNAVWNCGNDSHIALAEPYSSPTMRPLRCECI